MKLGYISVYDTNKKRIWCSGIIVPSHGTDQGSIPWMRKLFHILLNFFLFLGLEAYIITTLLKSVSFILQPMNDDYE
jgi:hypothetical protein